MNSLITNRFIHSRKGGSITMIRFNANLSLLFTEVDYPDRFEQAAEAGTAAGGSDLDHPSPVMTLEKQANHNVA
jgi:hydroxypyruvate isomerase